MMEKHATLLNGQVVFGPVPQLTQVLVIEGVEGIIPDGKEHSTRVRTRGDINMDGYNHTRDSYPTSCVSPWMVWSLRRNDRETRAYECRTVR